LGDFGQLFVKSRGAPIWHDGRALIMLDKVAAKLGEKFIVTIEATRSPYPQGVGVSEGVAVFGERVKRAVVWEYFSLPPRRAEVSAVATTLCIRGNLPKQEGFVVLLQHDRVPGTARVVARWILYDR
jgi:hypothetical protein